MELVELEHQIKVMPVELVLTD